MRNRLMISGASLAVTVMIAGALAAGIVEERYDERIDDLETRVSRLESEVGISSSTSGEDGEDGSSVNVSSSSSSSSSSTSSSVQSGSGSYTGTWSSNGDRTISLEIDDAGTYTLTAQVSSPLTVRVENDDGEEIPAFTLESDGEGTLTASAELEPGNYVLHVESDSQWVVTIATLNT